MATLTRLLNRLVALVHRERSERELTREVDAHLALLEDDFVTRGLTADQARVAARRAMGGVDQTKERHRDARSFLWLEDLRRDVPYALRGLARDRGFTAAAVLTLALGIGATTAIFSVVNTVLLQPLPYKDSDQLVRIVEHIPARNAGSPPVRRFSMSWSEFVDWRARTTTLSSLARYLTFPWVQVEAPGGSVRLSGKAVSSDVFAVLGVPPLLGRTLTPEDDAPSASTVVLSAAVWQRHFRSDPAIIGRAILFRFQGVGSRTLTVVGVMPPHFAFSSADDLFWASLPANATVEPGTGVSTVLARLREGVSIHAATEEANVIGTALRPLAPGSDRPAAAPPRFEVVSLKEEMVGTVRPSLRVLAAAVAVVLLIVCANVANLLLARGTARHREIAVRLAIGAGRARIVRQILTESVLLAGIGGTLGVWLAVIAVRALERFATVNASGLFQLALGTTILPRLDEIHIDGRFLVIALVLTAMTSVLFGLAPAMQLSRLAPLRAMGARGATRGTSRVDTRARGALVVGQLVMATMLLVGAGLLIRSFAKLSSVETGYDTTNVLAFQLALPYDYPTARKLAIVETLLPRLRALPRAEATGFAYAGPLLNISNTMGVVVPPGRSIDEVRDYERPRAMSISNDYLRTIGVRLVEGRWLDEGDGTASIASVLLNRTVTREYFGDSSPVGAIVRFDSVDGMHTQMLQVAGVVDDIRHQTLDRAPTPQMYFEYHQMLALTRARGMTVPGQELVSLGFLSFALRVTDRPEASIADVRALVSQIDPAAGIDGIAPMEDVVSAAVTRPRFYAVLIGLLAGVAGILAAVGVYGVLAYAVQQRTQEIGVRMALGAQRSEVLRLVLRRGMMLTAVGIALGIAGAAGLTRYLSGMLYGVTPLDASTYAATAGLFALVALLASYLPARRATQVDPMVALRCE